MRENLRNFRLKLGFTLEQMAEFIGYSRTYYNSIELGSKRGTLDFWDKIQEKFSLDDSEVYGLTKKK